MTPRQERNLIQRVVAGDRGAAETLVRAHQAALYAYMLRISRRPELAEDVTQEAFVRALTHINRYDPRFRFSTWLFTIAKRLYVNAQQRLAPVYDSDVVGAAGARGGATGISTIAGEETGRNTSAALLDAMDSLSEDQREVVVLFYQLSWPVEHIAEYLEQPEGTIKSHLHRARKRLRQSLMANSNYAAELREEIE